MSEKRLTTKQQLFVEAFLANPNATEAARKAGYKGSDTTLAQVGAENLRKPHIAALLGKRVEEAAMTANEWLSEVAELARGAEREADRLTAYGLLGKSLNLTNNSTVNLGGKVEIERVIRPKVDAR